MTHAWFQGNVAPCGGELKEGDGLSESYRFVTCRKCLDMAYRGEVKITGQTKLAMP